MNTSTLSLIVAPMMLVWSAGCVVTPPCASGLVDCGAYCADLRSDETDCGRCGQSCGTGDFCSDGLCIVGTCFADNSQCNHDYDCCSNYCASDGNCGCIPTSHSGCAGSSDCCSGHCARDGVCDP